MSYRHHAAKKMRRAKRPKGHKVHTRAHHVIKAKSHRVVHYTSTSAKSRVNLRP